MSSTRRFTPVAALVAIILVSVLVALAFPEEQQLPLFGAIFLVGLLFWVIWMGGGWRMAERDAVLIVEDFTGHLREVREGGYLFIPIIHTVVAKLPNYPLVHAFEVNAIDTRTTRLQQIKQIKVRFSYGIAHCLTWFSRAEEITQCINDIERKEKLQRDNPELWIRALNGALEGIVEEAIRSGIWTWAEEVLADDDLRLDMASLAVQPKTEHEPYALSLNRAKLSRYVEEAVRMRLQRWGLRLHRLCFATVELDQQVIDRATRNKDAELAEAEHRAAQEAIFIRLKGKAEAEVRAHMIRQVIEVLMNQKDLDVGEQALLNIVRAAMYSDGQMLWQGMMEKSAAANVKAA